MPSSRKFRPLTLEQRAEWSQLADERIHDYKSHVVHSGMSKKDKWEAVDKYAESRTPPHKRKMTDRLAEEFTMTQMAATTRLATWSPSQHTSIIAGRPCQVPGVIVRVEFVFSKTEPYACPVGSA